MAKMFTIQLTLKGEAPLLLHSERGVNSFDPLQKQIAAINSKRTRKTEDDKLLVKRLEWEIGFYHTPTKGPYIPGANIKACLIEAATAFRGGTAVKRGVLMLSVENPLIYSGPRDIEGLWRAGTFADERSVGIGKKKVMRCRPRFDEWAVEASLMLNSSVLDIDTFQRFLAQAGRITGLGDYRPTMGRFVSHMEVIAESEYEDATDQMNEEDPDVADEERQAFAVDADTDAVS